MNNTVAVIVTLSALILVAIGTAALTYVALSDEKGLSYQIEVSGPGPFTEAVPVLHHIDNPGEEAITNSDVYASNGSRDILLLENAANTFAHGETELSFVIPVLTESYAIPPGRWQFRVEMDVLGAKHITSSSTFFEVSG